MKQQIKQYSFFIIILTMLVITPGCGRFGDWCAHHLDQGSMRGLPTAVVKKNVRTARIYDDFATVGIFNALWLSDAVRRAFVDVYAQKNALAYEAKEEYWQRQKRENESYISFYLLSYIPASPFLPGESKSPWALRLKVDGVFYEPITVQATELSPIYTTLLQSFMSKHKTVSLVKFLRKTKDGQPIIHRTTTFIELWLSTASRSITLRWPLRASLNAERGRYA